MRHTPVSALTALIVSAVLFTDVSAQATGQPPRRNQPPTTAAGTPRFDPATVFSVQGTLIAVDTVLAMSGMSGTGVHATLKTATETLPVHLGPVQYLASQKVHLNKGDVVTITGSRVSISTVPTILAAYAVKGTDTLKFRDANGLPLWRGMRMRPPQ